MKSKRSFEETNAEATQSKTGDESKGVRNKYQKFEENEENYFRCYSDVKIHEQMLFDKARTLAYRRALQENRSFLKDATVVDVGAGTGILSQFAVQAGVSKVFAVEPTSMAAIAEKISKENGTESSIAVIQSKIEAASIPVKVDAIVSEWMGYGLLYESMLPSVLHARDHFLKPDGHMYPCTATLFLAPISDDEFQNRLDTWKTLGSLYDLSMESLVSMANDAVTVKADNRHLDMESILANASQLQHFDLMTVTVQDVSKVQSEFDFCCYGHNMMHGFATWFTVTFPGGTAIDTSPYAEQTHWGQTVLYLKQPLAIKQDSKVQGTYRMQPSTENPRFWDIEIEYKVDSHCKVLQTWQCAD